MNKSDTRIGIPLGMWDIDGYWYPNDKLDMLSGDQYLHNLSLGYICHRRPGSVLEYSDMKKVSKHETDRMGLDQHVPGAKLDQGKNQLGLLLAFSKAIESIGELATFGAVKYSPNGWAEVPDGINRYTDAMLRHLLKETQEDFDPDSNVPHATAVAWNALARLELILRDMENK